MSEETRIESQWDVPKGFEEEDAGDFIVPRIKVVQALSPEFKERLAEEGDIINSLTKDKLNGQVFVPVWKFNSNIEWKPRSQGGGIACIARDGKCGIPSDGSAQLICAQCRRNEFDNTKQGVDSLPKCTKYINFFGFIVGEPLPIVLSFAKTNYNEGKKMFSLAKVTVQNMWHHGYALTSKKVSKNGNEWYIINVAAAGPTDELNRQMGAGMYQQFRNQDLKFDMDENQTEEGAPGPGMASEKDIKDSEF